MLTRASDTKLVKKLWGYELWFVNTPDYCGKELNLYNGFQSSLHYHIQKNETFVVIEGRVRLEIAYFLDNGSYTVRSIFLEEGDSYIILPGVAHRFSVAGENDARIFEVSTFHDEADVVRLEPSRRIDDIKPTEETV